MKIKFFLRTFVFLLVLFIVLFGVQIFIVNPDSYTNVAIYSYYKEPEDSIDVAFIGTSTTYSAYYPVLAYRQQGYTSIILATPGMRGSLYKSAVKVIQEKQNPSLYVVELYGFTYSDQYKVAPLSKWIDSLPYGETRFEAIDELIENEDKFSYYFPLTKYHEYFDRSKISSTVITEKMHLNEIGYSVLKNYSTYSNTMLNNDEENDFENFKISEDGQKYLNVLLDYFHDCDIENVLFIRWPETDPLPNMDSYYAALEIIENAGYDYLDLSMESEMLELDPMDDYRSLGHVNVYGMEKITTYLSDYIYNHYDIRTDHSEEVTREWDYCAELSSDIITTLKTDTSEEKGIRYWNYDF